MVSHAILNNTLVFKEFDLDCVIATASIDVLNDGCLPSLQACQASKTEKVEVAVCQEHKIKVFIGKFPH